MEIKLNNGWVIRNKGRELLERAADLAYEVRQMLEKERGIQSHVCGYSGNADRAWMEIHRATPGTFRDTIHEMVAKVTVFADGRENIELF